ncbi:TIGR01459 family HAD-type hydrolase [Candidatus Finniella inopinata]|uniref:TIGR01459 family HAD-type hydrolase n=1 Tax=Candidatus Finniella inopinata TaxID=1696036 RepID=A0A4Q7DJA4_9PROT|nr:TIGR01459 family HAD-type hydrolase [Candidatus Finniella inopinata]RZI46225.1 TIGR01459 family HAD-type hydrolase [Candidatus Finniella inopinata]
MTTQLSNFNGLADTYDLFLFDLWGVVHNGKEPFLNTLACLKDLKDQGKSAFLLSNSPRLAQPTADRLTQMGIPADYYQGVHTSGTDCHKALRDRPDEFYKSLGEKLFHIGPGTYTPIFDTLDYVSVPILDQVDFVLISGTVDWVETLEEYDPLLNAALARNLPMVCANADKQAIHGNDRVLCAGLLAEMYAEGGGTVRIHGKPNPIMYERAHDLAQQQLGKTIKKDKILMIGDSLATDIKGANAYGIDSLMVLTGVHGAALLPHWNQKDTFQSHLSALTTTYQTTPTYVVAQL